MTLLYDNKGVLQYPSHIWAVRMGMWSPGGLVHCSRGMTGAGS